MHLWVTQPWWVKNIILLIFIHVVRLILYHVKLLVHGPIILSQTDNSRYIDSGFSILPGKGTGYFSEKSGGYYNCWWHGTLCHCRYNIDFPKNVLFSVASWGVFQLPVLFFSSVPLPKDIAYFRRERELVIKRAMEVIRIYWDFTYCQISDIRHTKFHNLNVCHLVLQLSLHKPLQAGVDTAPTTSELLTILLLIKVCLIL